MGTEQHVFPEDFVDVKHIVLSGNLIIDLTRSDDDEEDNINLSMHAHETGNRELSEFQDTSASTFA